MSDMTADEMRRLMKGHDWNKKFPARKEVDGRRVYFWHSAFSGAFDYHYILPGWAWERLCHYNSKYDLEKRYSSADLAIADLENALSTIERLQ